MDKKCSAKGIGGVELSDLFLLVKTTEWNNCLTLSARAEINPVSKAENIR